MLIEASKQLGIDLSESYMIGDRWGDVEAGQRSGCKNTFFIDYGYKEKKPTGDFISVKSLRECADIILKIQTNNN
jgi:D-glycero-D-manno-heptose 1,7-bisphosphate phosphatase